MGKWYILHFAYYIGVCPVAFIKECDKAAVGGWGITTRVSGSKPESRATHSSSQEGPGAKFQPSKSLSYGYPGKKLGLK